MFDLMGKMGELKKTLDDAEKVFEAEMKSAGKGMIPGF